MATNPENTPEHEDLQQTQEMGQELGPQTRRWLTHLNRGLILENVRVLLQGIRPVLDANEGFAFYHTYHDDAEYRILVTNNTDVAQNNNTVIVANKERAARYDEPGFPDGRIMELTDVTIPARTRWLNVCRENLDRHPNDSGWEKPDYTTFLEASNSTLRIVGNIGRRNFTPAPARDLSEVAADTEALWRTSESLLLCGRSDPEDNITDFKLVG